MADVKVRLEVTPSGISDGPWAYMRDRGMTFQGNVAEVVLPFASGIQSILLTFTANTLAAKVDYVLYLDNRQKTKGTAKIYHGNVGTAEIRFFMKDPAA